MRTSSLVTSRTARGRGHFGAHKLIPILHQISCAPIAPRFVGDVSFGNEIFPCPTS